MSALQSDFERAYQAAELAGFAAHVRAVFLSATQASPEVVCMAVRVRVDSGCSVIEAEYLDADGAAVGGVGL